MNLTAVYIANLFGILLGILIFCKKTNSFDIRNKETKLLLYMAMLAIDSCVLDCVACTLEGKSGSLVFFVVYLINFWLYVSNIIFGYLWVLLVGVYFRGKLSKFQKGFIVTLAIVAVVLLAINFIKPLLFSVDNTNVYHREEFFWLFALMDVALIIEGIVDCIIAKVEGGRLKFFPVIEFIIPVAIGITIQALFYGVSVIWPSIIISLCTVKYSFQMESSYKDRLTGLYNRYYLDIIRDKLKPGSKFTTIMFDVNSFKNINDNYGHQEGDKAIYQTAVLLKEAMGNLGFVLRFAGDEFIVILNTVEKETIDKCFERLQNNLDDFNKSKKVKYSLGVSYGYCLNNGDNIPLNKLIEKADKMMLDSKREYYNKHPELSRRR